jgi:RNA polymerase sigma-70 factor (ECF subfamily)
VRVAVRRLRRRGLRRALRLPSEPLDYEALASPDASPEQRSLVARVYRALDGLPAKERVAWVLRHAQGESLEQAARLSGCSLSTYQRRLRRAVSRLDKELCRD